MNKVIFILLFVVLRLSISGQTFTASVDRTTVSAGERIKLTYRMENGTFKDFKLPSLDGFSIVSGPMQSQSTTIVNGSYSQKFEITYFLSANKKGKLTIPSATAQSSGKTVRSNAIDINVVEGNTSQSNQNNSNSGSSTNIPNTEGKNIFVTSTASKNTVYEGEQVFLTIQLYSLYNNVSLEDIRYPELNGGWVQDVQDAVDTRFRQDIVNGKRYNAATLKKSILIPQRSGKLVFDPVTASVIVQTVQKTGNPWDDFFGGQVKEENLNLKSGTLTFNVLPLPVQNKPISFKNAVGNFSMKVSVDKTKVNANDAITLKLTISGSGNLMLIEKPNIIFPSSFEVFDPKIKDDYKVTLNGITGSKTFEYLIIPRSGGKFTIESIPFSFFNPDKKSYTEILSDSIALEVEGAVVDNPVMGGGEEVDLVGKDIRYIYDESTAPLASGKFFFKSMLYFILSFIPFLGILLIVIFRKSIFHRTPDLELKRMKKATRIAIKRLQIAKKLLDENNKDKYFEEINKSLLSYLSDKFNIDYADMNKEFISSKLSDKISPEITSNLLNLIDTCEFARFAPPGNDSRSDIYQEAVKIISTIEKNS
jgi:hypothetical protein